MVRSPNERACKLDNPSLFLTELRRRDFAAFARKAWPTISAGEDVAWNWHLDAMAYQLARVERGENLRLLVTISPRNGKSKMISCIWIAWMLGQNPKLNFVGVSYSNELSGKLARDCREIIQSRWYRELFPGTIISPKRSAAMDFETTAGGGRLATSITGTLTGRGGDIIVIDDAIKPDEAMSDITRENVNDWYRSTLASRLNDKSTGAIILVMQRLHQYDLAGMLIEAGGWYQLKIPAIATQDELIPLTRGKVHFRKTGDLLHPEREPIEVLAKIKADMGSLAYEAQYQQDPAPAVGNVIRREWFGSFKLAEIERHPGATIQSWDTASKDNPHNAWSVCITALRRGKDIYIIDVFRRRLQIHELKKQAIALANEYRPSALLIEDQASGEQLIQLLRAEANGPAGSPIAIRPEGDKLTRALGVSAMIEGGRVYLPEDAPWLAEFLSELLAFPNSRYADQVDALSQLLGWARTKDTIVDTPPAGPIVYTQYGDDPGKWSDESEDCGSYSSGGDPWLDYRLSS